MSLEFLVFIEDKHTNKRTNFDYHTYNTQPERYRFRYATKDTEQVDGNIMRIFVILNNEQKKIDRSFHFAYSTN